MSRLLLFAFFLFLFILPSCKKKSDESSSRPHLMTIHVGNNYFNPVLGGVIYISGRDGKTIDDVMCHGSGDYSFYGESGTSAPAWIDITIVRIEPFWHSYSIVAETYTRLQPGEWTLTGSRADTIGSVNPVFVNVPEHTGNILISSSGYSNLTFTPGLIPIPLYKSPDDLLFSIPTLTGWRYQWAGWLSPGFKDTLDLSQTLYPESTTLRLGNVPVSYYECRVDGFSDSASRNNLPLRVVELLDTDNPDGTVKLCYPPAKFSWFHSEFSVVDDWNSGKQYYYQAEGAVPTLFKRNSAIPGDIYSEGYHLNIHATGDFDALCGLWIYQSPYQGMVEWRVYGPDTATSLIVPETAAALNEQFPWLHRDSLACQQAELIDAINISGYTTLINKIYNPSKPSQMNRIELTKSEISSSVFRKK